MQIIETIADRRIRQAQEDGLFDDLPGHGKPIADLGRQRPAGWWALRQIETERAKAAAEALHDELRSERPALWRLGSVSAVRDQVADMNRRIAAHNRRYRMAPATPLDPEQTVATWRRLRGGRAG